MAGRGLATSAFIFCYTGEVGSWGAIEYTGCIRLEGLQVRMLERENEFVLIEDPRRRIEIWRED